MVDIGNEAEIIPKKLSFLGTPDECRSRITSFIDNPAVDTTIIAEDETIADEVPLFSLRQIYKDLALISVVFTLILTAYAGILTLQSSLNAKGNVGVNSLIIIYACTLFSSIFLTGIFMDIFGLKWTIMIGNIGYIIYVSANIWPTPIVMYIAAMSLGLVAAPFWTSQATYVNRIARYYAYHTKKNVDYTVSLFFGIFFAMFNTCTIWGNLVSYFVLNQSNIPQKTNCGIYFDPLSKNNDAEPAVVSIFTRYLLCAIFAGICILPVILLFFLDQIRLAKSQPVKQSLKKSIDVLRSFLQWKYIDQLLLIPITIWTLGESAFMAAQFTRAFITCLVGIRFIGLIMICGGVFNAAFSYVFGALVKCIGRMGCLIIAAALNYTAIALMYFWEPRDDQMYMLYVIVGLWATASAAWQSQVIAVYTILYAEIDSSAIAKYRLWKTVGALVTYSYASYITIELTLYILFGTLSLSMICYTIVEIHVRWKNYKKKSALLINEW